jgi:hypothetical protein
MRSLTLRTVLVSLAVQSIDASAQQPVLRKLWVTPLFHDSRRSMVTALPSM